MILQGSINNCHQDPNHGRCQAAILPNDIGPEYQNMSNLRQRPRRAAPSSDPEPLGNDEPDSSNGHADTPATTDEDEHEETEEEDDDDEDSDDDNEEVKTHGISALDILRVISVLVFASCALSYYVTSSESLIWGYKRPWFTKLPELERFIVYISPRL